MKRTFYLLALFLLLLPPAAWAYDFEVDRIRYNITSEADLTCEVTSHVYSGSVDIPSTVEYRGRTYAVTGIGNSAFYQCWDLISVTIPNSVTSIGSSAFYQCLGLTSMTIPNSVTSIGNEAFASCLYLISITIPSSVTSIGYSVFKDCYSLTSLTIPNSVTSIGGSAFEDCSRLTSLIIPNSVTSIGGSAFENCSNLTDLHIADGNTTLIFEDNVFKDAPLSSVYIGRNFDYPYSYISSSSCPFYRKETIQSLVIGDSVTSIADYAFSSCSGLTSLSIPTSVTSIGNYAFRNCSGLTSLTLPTSVTSIGNGAFQDCSGLTSLTLSTSVTSIGDGVFSGCSGLTSLLIPNSVTSIGGSAFSGCSGLTSLSIPNSVTSIGDYAFSNCSGLTSLTLPTSVASIGDYAFSNCSGLASLALPTSITNIGDGVFNGCSGLTSLSIPNSVMSIGGLAFSGCSGLTSLSIPNSVTSVGDYAFSGCSGLTDLYIADGNSTLTFASSVFKNTPLFSVYMGRNFECSSSLSVYPFYGKETIQSLIIGDSVTTIGSGAFGNCDNLHSVTISAGVLSIEKNAFPSLEKVIWLPNTPPEGYKNVDGQYNYVSNDSYSELYNMKVYPYLSSLFEVGGIKYVPVSPSERTCVAIDCSYDSTSEIRIGHTVNYRGVEMEVLDIRPYLCIGNNKMRSLHIDSYSGNIGLGAFSGCANLDSLTIPNSVTSIGSNCFEDCSSLRYVHIGSGIRVLPASCFGECSALPDIVIPATVDSIGNNVFEGCSSLAYVTMADRETELKLGYNYNNRGGEPLFADCPLDTVYIGGNISYSTESSRGYSPFYRNTSLRTVRITDKETEISENEFYGCSNLQNVTIGDGVERIGNYAFSGCAALNNFTFGSGLKEIGEEAFSDCTAMTQLVSNTVTPPVCGAQALDDINKWTCELFVPEGAKASYQLADQWKEFFFMWIVGLEQPIAAEPNDALERVLGGTVQVYDVSGRLLRQLEHADSLDEALMGLGSGTYILRGSGASYKVGKN